MSRGKRILSTIDHNLKSIYDDGGLEVGKVYGMTVYSSKNYFEWFRKVAIPTIFPERKPEQLLTYYTSHVDIFRHSLGFSDRTKTHAVVQKMGQIYQKRESDDDDPIRLIELDVSSAENEDGWMTSNNHDRARFITKEFRKVIRKRGFNGVLLVIHHINTESRMKIVSSYRDPDVYHDRPLFTIPEIDFSISVSVSDTSGLKGVVFDSGNRNNHYYGHSVIIDPKLFEGKTSLDLVHLV